MNDLTDLHLKKCRPCEGGVPSFSAEEIRGIMPSVPGWDYAGGELVRTFEFKNYHQTMSFANAVAWVAHREDHHPLMEVGYKTCRVRYSTHAVNGLTINDFICAAKLNRLIA